MKAKTSRRAPPKVGLSPHVKFWLELDGERVFCPGVCQILQAVDETGSIKQAAARVGRSYRFVWGRLKQAEQAFGEPLVSARVGGRDENRSCVTPAGRELMESFLTLRRRIFDVVDAEFADRFASRRSGRRRTD